MITSVKKMKLRERSMVKDQVVRVCPKEPLGGVLRCV
jgi:hypothetical protein